MLFTTPILIINTFSLNSVNKRFFSQLNSKIPTTIKGLNNTSAYAIKNVTKIPNSNNNNYFNRLYLLLHWPQHYGYSLLDTDFVSKKLWQKKTLNFWLNYKAEMVLRFGKRNSNLVVHAPKIPSLVYKKHLMSWETLRNWNNQHASDLLFGFSTGRCGFKPIETKSFVASDTLIRVGLWFITRFLKRLSPFKLRLMGNTRLFRKYLHRFKPSKPGNYFKYKIYSIEDATPIPFNGCRLEHMARKRYRRHEYQYRKVKKHIKSWNDFL